MVEGDDARKSVESTPYVESVTQRVRDAFDSSYYWKDVLALINEGYETISGQVSNSQLADDRGLLQAVVDELHSRGRVSKFLYDGTENPKQIAETKILVSEILKHQKHIAKIGILSSADRTIRKELTSHLVGRTAQSPGIPIAFIFNKRGDDYGSSRYQECSSAVGRLENDMAFVLHHYQENRDPVSIVNKVSLSGRTRHPLVPNPWSQRFNGVSYGEIIRADSEEQGVERLVRYLEGMPKGDLFWRNLVLSTFFTMPSVKNEDGSEVNWQNPVLTEKIFRIQTALADKVLLPFLKPDSVDHSADSALIELIAVQSPQVAQLLGSVLAYSAYNAAGALRSFHPGIPIDTIQQKCPVNNQAVERYHPPSYMMTLDEAMWQLFTDPRLETHLRTRFQGHTNCDSFIQGILSLIKNTDFDVVKTDGIIETLERFSQLFQKNLFEKINTHAAELDNIIQSVKKKFQIPSDYLLIPNILYQFTFDENTFGHMIGIKSITYRTLKNESMTDDNVAGEETRGEKQADQNKTHFMITFYDDTALNGAITDDGSVVGFPQSLDNYPEIKRVLELMSLSVISDHKQRIVKRKTAPSPRNGNADKKSRHTTRDGSRRPRRSPTTTYRYDEPNVYKVSDLIKELEQDAADKRIPYRLVRIHNRRLPGVYPYLELVEEFQQADEAKRDLLVPQLIAAREHMANISQTKRATNPGVNLEEIKDPITGEVIATSTWVCLHISPSIKPGTTMDYGELYKQSFIHSATAFSNVMILWLAGQEVFD